MSEELELPVDYNGEELSFPLTIVPIGYTYRMVVVVEGKDLTFERDEEINLRVLMKQEDVNGGTGIDKGLLAAILKSLEYLLE